jgi:hypothetical protein
MLSFGAMDRSQTGTSVSVGAIRVLDQSGPVGPYVGLSTSTQSLPPFASAGTQAVLGVRLGGFEGG